MKAKKPVVGANATTLDLDIKGLGMKAGGSSLQFLGRCDDGMPSLVFGNFRLLAPHCIM